MKSKLILLIEDNPDDEELMIRALTRNKISGEIIVMRDGAEAVQFFSELSAKGGVIPSLVLLDLKLPKVDGLEVLRYIRENQYTTLLPVVVLTSSGEEKDILESYALRANSYIRKPVDFSEFTEVIHHLGKYWLNINESTVGLKC